jgi:hypothetical protein
MIEARETFRHKGPDFVINDKGVETRTVQIANDTLIELGVPILGWPKRKGPLDAWSWQSAKVHRKHFNKGRHYRTWFGPEAGYEGWLRGKGAARSKRLWRATQRRRQSKREQQYGNEDYNELQDHIHRFDRFDNGHVRSLCHMP